MPKTAYMFGEIETDKTAGCHIFLCVFGCGVWRSLSLSLSRSPSLALSYKPLACAASLIKQSSCFLTLHLLLSHLIATKVATGVAEHANPGEVTTFRGLG